MEDILWNLYGKEYSRQVGTVARQMSYNKDIAEDIVQEAYAKAFKMLDQYDPKRGKIKPWFNTIMFNTLRDYQRSFSHTVGLNENMACEEDFSYILNLIEKEIQDIKNPVHKRAVELFYRNGYTGKQIGELVPLSPSNIRTVCSRFKNNLLRNHNISV